MNPEYTQIEQLISASGTESFRYCSGLKLELMRQARRQRQSLHAKRQFLQVVASCLFCSIMSLHYWGYPGQYPQLSWLPINPDKLATRSQLMIKPEEIGTFEHALAFQEQRTRVLQPQKTI